jgi:transposase InsO family protein
MIAKSSAQFLSDLGVDKSHSRSHTPDDNPFLEAQFKTMKYRPDYPQRFAFKNQALAWARDFFPWYNQERHHLALGLLTPTMVHFGQTQREPVYTPYGIKLCPVLVYKITICARVRYINCCVQ